MCCYVANFVFLADDDELTFDPGETITNIEFVSSVLSNSDTLQKYSYEVTILTGLLCNLLCFRLMRAGGAASVAERVDFFLPTMSS